MEKKYNTTINIIGGLKDSHGLTKALESYFRENDSLAKLIIDRNEFNLKTGKSRKRIKRAVEISFLAFRNELHKNLLQSIINCNLSGSDMDFILLWQFALNDRLFRELTSKVFMQHYYSGRATIKKDDVQGYIKANISHNKNNDLTWSESTIAMLATKYLSFMTKLGFLKGVKTKTFNFRRPSPDLLVIFVYLILLHESDNHDILTNELFPLAFYTQAGIIDDLKKMAFKDYLKMEFNGTKLNIDLIYSYGEICNVLYNRP